MRENHRHNDATRQSEENQARKALVMQEQKRLQGLFLLPKGTQGVTRQVKAAREKWVEENPGVIPPWIKFSMG